METVKEMVTSRPVRSTLPWSRLLLRAALLALALWMASPIVTSTYVEAYMARLQSMAILNHRGLITLDDQAYPINTELLYFTRPGMVWLMQGAMALFHSTSVGVLRLITIGSLALLSWSGVLFARRWAEAPAWAVLACVVLTPGILNSGFFFADNLVSAALTSFALALISEHSNTFRSYARWFCIGTVVAAATLVRLDSVLMTPAVFAVAWLCTAEYRRLLRALILAAVGAIVVFAVAQGITGISLSQAFRVGRLFSVINNNPAIYQTGLPRTQGLIFFGFFGLITPVLLAFGIWRYRRLYTARATGVMTIIPALFYISVLPHANEIRDFCIMGAPFVLLHAANGLVRLIALTSSLERWQRMTARLTFGAFAVVLIAPPYISMRDGPRTITGGIYSPVFWRQWQSRTAEMIEAIKSDVSNSKPDQSVLVISSQFEPDRYLHLRLLQEGFEPEMNTAAAACSSIEIMHKGDHTWVSIRTENPYGLAVGPQADRYLEALQIFNSLNCLRGRDFTHTYFYSVGPSGELYWPALAGPDVSIPRQFLIPILHQAKYGFLGRVELTSDEVKRLHKATEDSLIEIEANGTSRSLNNSTIRRLTARRYWMSELK